MMYHRYILILKILTYNLECRLGFILNLSGAKFEKVNHTIKALKVLKPLLFHIENKPKSIMSTKYNL